jgi:catechol 2,3-dioxygenase-like lactoylglutathione lyase family enzyme
LAQFISAVTLLVDDYDRAIDFYVNSLGFTLLEDTKLSDTKRWVLVAPSQADSQSTSILIAKADTDAQIASIGAQTGGRVSFFLRTDQFDQDYSAMLEKGVRFLEEPRDEVYAKVVVFEDPFGNKWDLLQPKSH